MSDPHERRPAFEPATRLLRPTGYDPTMPRPAAVMAAVLLLALRIFSGTAVLVAAAFAPEAVVDIEALTDDERSAAVVAAIVTAVIVLAVDAVLLRLIWVGRNWARVAIMIDNRENLGSDLEEAMAVTAQGLAEEVGGDARDEWRALCLKRHPALQAFADSPGCALIRIKVSSYVIVRRFQEVIEWRVEK